jgi:uncharacterized membrane protein
MLVVLDVAVPLTTSALLSLLGLIILFKGMQQYRLQSGAVKRAEQASGTIEEVGVQPVINGSETTYIPTIEYEYQTPTQRLRGETVYPGRSRFIKRFHSKSAVDSVIGTYEPGAETTVYYDRANPDHSFLIQEVQTGPNLATIVVGIGLIALSVFISYQFGIV